MTDDFPFGDERSYLPPVCGSMDRPGFDGLGCYRSLYHQGDHQAPSRDGDVFDTYYVSWPRAEEVGAAAA